MFMPGYQAAQANREWRRVRIVRPDERRIGFLGYGMMAQAPASVLKSLEFKVSAWVRRPRPAGEIPIYHAWIKATGYERASEHNTPSLEQTRQRAKIAAEKSRVTAESVKSTISDMRDWLQMRTGGNRVNSSEF